MKIERKMKNEIVPHFYCDKYEKREHYKGTNIGVNLQKKRLQVLQCSNNSNPISKELNLNSLLIKSEVSLKCMRRNNKSSFVH